MKSISVNDIIELIKELDLDVDVDELDPEIDLPSQDVDSLDLANLLFGLEDKFSITIPEEFQEENQEVTINKIVELVNRLMKK